VWVSDRGIVLYDDAGDPTHMVGVMKDVTQERAAEAAIRESAELYGTLFRRATNPAFHVDGSGRFIDANAAFLRVLDMTEADVLKRKCSDILPPTLCRALERSSEPDERAPILETEVCGRGQPRHLMVTIVPCKVGDRFTRFGLCTDITDHHTMRTDLELSRASLREQAVSLEERNVALRVILDQRAQDRVDLERTIAQNLETMVEPVITRLLARLGKTPEGIQLETIRQSIREITHPARRLGGSSLAEVQLTRREVEIVNLTRLGKSSEQMAVVLFLSPATIAYHRQNIRRKLGLLGKSTRLSSYLAVTHA
jgi:PAS domain S-box-containing protein